MIRTNLYDATKSRKLLDQRGIFSVIEYEKDISISPQIAQEAYFASLMNVRKKQLVANMDGTVGVTAQAGEMQLMIGNIEAATDIHSAGDLMKKFVKSVVTDETTIKPHYEGIGTLVFEPTFKFIILQDVSLWKEGMVIEDGMFLACEDTVGLEVIGRKNISSLVFGREGIFNTLLLGNGVVALESMVPSEELLVVDLEDDVIKIDGDMAIAWSPTLKFTVEKTTATLVGSFASGEGLVNVYRGTGRVLIAPVRKNKGIAVPRDNQ
ncbi:MAG: AIM24 family protein [Lachnospiraceae bacterium]|nr:AIM24 family protein [Lachnospiraceae bacterium]